MTRATVLGRTSLANFTQKRKPVLTSFHQQSKQVLTRERADFTLLNLHNGRNKTRDSSDPSFPHTFQEVPAIVSYPVKDIFLSSPELT
jgi:hypothetical protein